MNAVLTVSDVQICSAASGSFPGRHPTVAERSVGLLKTDTDTPYKL